MGTAAALLMLACSTLGAVGLRLPGCSGSIGAGVRRPAPRRSALRPPELRALRGGEAALDGDGGGVGNWSAAIFEAGDVVLQSGAVFRDVRIAYEVHGTMNADKSNVILHPTSFGAQSEDLRYRIGPGPDYTLDTSSYCVVIVNLLGNGLSSSPSHLRDGKGSMRDYPMSTIYDNVVLHERLLREVIKVDAPLALIFGYSMGAMAALHFAALFPDKVARVAAVCGAAKTSHYNRIFLASLRATLCADDAWDETAQAETRKSTLCSEVV
jgi:homoserine acetyltransferase